MEAATQLLNITRRHYPPVPDGSGGGVFFTHPTGPLPAGEYAIRCQIQFDEGLLDAPVDLELDCTALSGHVAAHLRERIAPDDLGRADRLTLRFTLDKQARLIVRGRVPRGIGHVHLRRLLVHAITQGGAETEVRERPRPRKIRGLMMGTTGTCNASCASCPTNKLVREHVPSGIMPLATFKRVIDEIADGGFVFGKNKLGLGLFAEPLMDPHIVERVQYVRERLPRMRVLLNTNMGPFNERRHGVLAKLVFRFSVHVEALSPELYAELMEPLRAENVFPKIERLLELAPEKVNIAVPISTRNEAEFDALRAYWMGKGARNVCDLALSNRTTDALDYFEKSLGTAPTACGESVHDDLVIDWDGTVLACCQDFMRREVLGNVNESSITEIYDAEARRKFTAALKAGEWNALASCRTCKRDPKEERHGSDED
jgi:radical SAM protein with 4Fe4S-binding SPASM domain